MLSPRGDRLMSEALAIDINLTLSGFNRPNQSLRENCLTVSLNPSNPKDFTRFNFKTDVVERRVIRDGISIDIFHHNAGEVTNYVTPTNPPKPDIMPSSHHTHDFFSARLSRIERPNGLATS